MTVIPASEVEFVERAAKYLENPSFLVRLADLMGMPLEGVLKLAPHKVTDTVTVALRRALDVAVFTVPKEAPPLASFPSMEDRAWWTGYRHSATTAWTGGAGGLFGTLGLLVELPVTTCIMLRSMIAIAREYGEDVHDIDARLECLSLFGMGGPSKADDEMDASYLAVRTSMGTLVKHASKFVAHTPSQEVMVSIKNGTAPTLVKLISKISRRFESAVQEKIMAYTIPLIGAVAGASVNVLFAEHFNAIARYHFGLRHLERRWGGEPIRAIYRDAANRFRTRKRWFETEVPDFGYRGDGQFALTANKPR